MILIPDILFEAGTFSLASPFPSSFTPRKFRGERLCDVDGEDSVRARGDLIHRCRCSRSEQGTERTVLVMLIVEWSIGWLIVFSCCVY